MADDRARIREIITDDPLTWDTAWKQKLTIWEVSAEVQPPLRDVIESGEVPFPKTGRALVPGCGRGFDPVFIASSLGLDVIGLDVSSTAVQAANEYAKSKPPLAQGSVKFELQDFFKLDAKDGMYDLIYDYTFFVAIPPAMRPTWGEKMQSLVRPGGYLITLIFPLAPAAYEGGPPFYVTPQHQVDVLGSGWEKVIDKIPERSHELHVGKERLVVWRRM